MQVAYNSLNRRTIIAFDSNRVFHFFARFALYKPRIAALVRRGILCCNVIVLAVPLFFNVGLWFSLFAVVLSNN
jgi:hypothetical protein